MDWEKLAEQIEGHLPRPKFTCSEPHQKPGHPPFVAEIRDETNWPVFTVGHMLKCLFDGLRDGDIRLDSRISVVREKNGKEYADGGITVGVGYFGQEYGRSQYSKFLIYEVQDDDWDDDDEDGWDC
jgi:hypothetical protein